jgi:hypothetical protein
MKAPQKINTKIEIIKFIWLKEVSMSVGIFITPPTNVKTIDNVTNTIFFMLPP